ncbi:Uncharacterised protein [Mycobacteroides abscessus subsp. abscessus]|uniref:hypothetical protein n=1 Tax=Mycobacteroides abscessus TaxID=36809 RepID=UPI00092CCA00|nr:hypothetical protein [Mycobacteroides abscessus]SIH24643.1 Uncharacterised protein [Mycobacteroides abscessus subsp. abscessus]
MTAPDRLTQLSQRITALTGQTLTRDEITTLIGRAFEHQVDLDDDSQLRALAAGLVSSAAAPPTVSDLPAGQPAAPASSQPAAPHTDPAYPQSAPSGATAIATGVLALLGGISNFALAGVWAFALSDAVSEQDTLPSWYHWTFYVVGACLAIVAGTLLTGAVMTFKRNRLGPRVVAAGCALRIAVFFGDLAVTLAATNESGLGLYGSPGLYLSGLAFPVITLVLALLPSTKRWLTDGAASAPTTPSPTAAPGNRPPRWAVIAAVAVLVIALAAAGTYFGIQAASNHCDTAVAAAEEVLRLEFESNGLVQQNLPALKERLSPELYTQSEQLSQSVSQIPGADQYITHVTELTSKQIECPGTTARIESQFNLSATTPKNPELSTKHATFTTALEYQKGRWIVTKLDPTWK